MKKRLMMRKKTYPYEKIAVYMLLGILAAFIIIKNIPEDVSAGGAYTIEAGQAIMLNAQVIGNFRVLSGRWSCNSQYVTIDSQNGTTCTVRGISPTGDNLFAYISYNYTYYDRRLDYTGSDIDQFKIVVIPPSPRAVSFQTDHLSLEAGAGAQLIPVVTPANAVTTYSYTSSNPNIASVDASTGYVTAVNSGTASITVATGNNKTAECSVTVTNPDIILSDTIPKNNAADVSNSQVITFTYNQKISKGSGFPDIMILDTTTGENVEAVNEVSETVLTITPSQLRPGHSYKIVLPRGALARAGDTGIVSEEEELSFTVKAVEFTSDVDNREDVGVDQMITIQCSEDVQKGEKWDEIVLLNTENGEDAACKAELSGNTITIDPVESLDYETKYTLTIPAGAVKNGEGIALSSGWTLSFFTECGSLKVEETHPENGAEEVPIDTDLYLKFNYSISSGDAFDTISLKNLTSGQAVPGKASVNNSTLTFEPDQSLDYESNYQLAAPSGSLKNKNGEMNDEAFILEFLTVPRDREPVRAPEIQVQDGMVAITAEDEANIYYTLDGGYPITNGTVYSKPVMALRVNGTVRAVAVKNGSVSEESRKEYTAVPLRKWQKNFGGSSEDFYNSVAAAKDGYAAAGYGYPGSFGNGGWEGVEGKGGNDAVIVKYDKSGNIEWQKNFGGSGNDSYHSVAVCEDGYVAAGGSESFGDGDWEGVEGEGSSDAVIVKYDKSGNVEWQKNFGGSGYDFYSSVAVMSDGYMAAGRYGDSAVIVKYDKSGNVEWEKDLSDNNIYQYDLMNAFESGCLVVGKKSGGFRKAAVKYDKSGNMEWESEWGGASDHIYKSTIDVEDGYVAVGYFASGDRYSGVDVIIEKYDESGKQEWSKTGGHTNSDLFYSVAAMNDGYIAVGEAVYPRNKSQKSDTDDEAFIVKYDKSGNLKWESGFGGRGDDSYSSVAATENGCVAVGCSFPSSFGNGDWIDTEGKGSTDAVIVEFAVEDPEPEDPAIPKEGIVSVRAKDTVVKGEKFTADVFFQPIFDVSAVNITLTYPACLSYVEKSSKYQSVYATEKHEGTVKTLNISCDFTIDNLTLEKDAPCILASLSFLVDENCEYGTYNLTPELDKSFVTDMNYQQVAFSGVEAQELSVVSTEAKQIFILGSKQISIPVRYRIATFPRSAESVFVDWSVSDEQVASIDETGMLVPHKNGSVTITASNEGAGLRAEFEVTVSGIGTYLESLFSDVGKFAGNYRETDLNRKLYVPKDTKSINLSAVFTGGSLVCETYGVVFSRIPKEIEIDELPKIIRLTKREAEHDDTIYTIHICAEPVPEKTPDIRIDYKTERLTGFEENATYSMNGEAAVPVSGKLKINENMFGRTLVIVRKGNGDSTSDSEPLELEVPKHPSGPANLIASYSAKNKIGKITGVSAEMEYRKSGEEAWIPCTGTEISDLEVGTYQVRKKATDTEFKSEIAEVIVSTENAGTPSLSITPTPTGSEPSVTPIPTPAKKAEKLTIICTSKKIAAGKKAALKIAVSPKSVKAPRVMWEVSNINYASVSSKGIVKIKKKGAGKTITVIVTAMDGSRLKASIRLKGMKHAVTKVKIKKAPKTLKVKKKVSLHAAVKTTGKNANKVLKWSTSNSKYATVNSKGKVTAKKAGKGKTVKITASSTDGSNKKASIKIKIK